MLITSKRIVVTSAVIMASGCGGKAALPLHAGVSSNVKHGTVIRDVDGDTLHVLVNSQNITVRLLGVDTPETHDPRKPVQCYGPQSSAFTASYAAPSNRVTLTTEPSTGDTTDKYGRTLAYVYVPAHHTDLGATLLRKGYAKVYAFDNRHFLKRTLYEKLQAKAQAAKIGRWSACGS